LNETASLVKQEKEPSKQLRSSSKAPVRLYRDNKVVLKNKTDKSASHSILTHRSYYEMKGMAGVYTPQALV
jgi:hypothetical protein